MPESKTKSNLLFYCTLVLTHLYRDTLGLIQGVVRGGEGEGAEGCLGGGGVVVVVGKVFVGGGWWCGAWT